MGPPRPACNGGWANGSRAGHQGAVTESKKARAAGPGAGGAGQRRGEAGAGGGQDRGTAADEAAEGPGRQRTRAPGARTAAGPPADRLRIGAGAG
eukprot:3410721-Alexandrium_andersonii.AAC.1